MTKPRNYIIALGLCTSIWCASAIANTDEAADQPLQQPIQERLDWFMRGASKGDGDVHAQFWHPELTYTSSSGSRYGKPELMQGMWGSTPLPDDQVESWYHARDLALTIIGDAVIANFTLVAEPVDGSDASYFYNTGVMIEDEGEWRAINWNATARD